MRLRDGKGRSEREGYGTLGFFPSSISDSFEIWNVLGDFPLELLKDEKQDELTWRQEKSLMHNQSAVFLRFLGAGRVIGPVDWSS